MKPTRDTFGLERPGLKTVWILRGPWSRWEPYGPTSREEALLGQTLRRARERFHAARTGMLPC